MNPRKGYYIFCAQCCQKIANTKKENLEHFMPQKPCLSGKSARFGKLLRGFLYKCCELFVFAVIVTSSSSRLTYTEPILRTSCRACDHDHQLQCSASDPLRRASFGASLSVFDLLCRSCGCGQRLNLSFAPSSLGRGQVAPPPM